MKSTAMVATGMGSIAKAFGFSRPPMIEAPTNMRPRLIGNMANTNVPDPVVKLTVDAKQEVTIDPSVIGIDMPDEMVVKEISQRESYITQFPWAITAARGQVLWNTFVNPFMSVNDTTFTNPARWHTACSFASLPFKYWRGTMRYRFQIVCSEYHKGRLRVVYDPNVIQSLEGNIAMSRIVDLTNERDFVVDVSWSQPLAFRSVGVGDQFSTTAIAATDQVFSNGVLGLYVENDLTSPNTAVNNDILINVFVSTCDDFEVSVPADDIVSLLTYSPQAASEPSSDVPALDDDNAPVKTDADDEIMTCLAVDNTYDVHFGESIQSFRQLIRRYNFHSSVQMPDTAAGRYTWLINDRDFPRYRGKYANAIDLPVTGTTNINNARLTIINYLTPAYVAYRGGIRWKYVYHTDSTNQSDTAWAFRIGDTGGGYQNIDALIPFGTTSSFARARAQALPAISAGGEVTYTHAQPTLEVEFSYYTPYRFSCAKDVAGLATPSQITLNHSIRADATIVANAYFDRFVAGAEDFSLYLFNGAPPLRTIDLTV